MMPADGVASDAVDTRRTHWRGALIGVGLAVGVGLLVFFAPQRAHAADDPGLLGSTVGQLADAVGTVVTPVVAPLPDARELPVVGSLVGEVADSEPVQGVTAPISGLVDGLLGREVVAPVVDPVGGFVDGALGELAGAEPAATGTDPATESDTSAIDASGLAGTTASRLLVPLLTRVGELGIVVATGAGGSDHGPVSVPGGITPTSAVTAGGPPIGPVAAVLGAGLLFLLARGRVRPAGFRAPPSPVFGTDTSPD